MAVTVVVRLAALLAVLGSGWFELTDALNVSLPVEAAVTVIVGCHCDWGASVGKVQVAVLPLVPQLPPAADAEAKLRPEGRGTVSVTPVAVICVSPLLTVKLYVICWPTVMLDALPEAVSARSTPES